MFELLTQPWPWYIAGPVIGLTVPMILLIGGKMFGVSSNFRHFVSACGVSKDEFFNYNWKKDGGWNIVFIVGAVIGGFLGGYVFMNPNPIDLNPDTISGLQNMGITDFSGFVPLDIFTWSALTTPVGIVVLVLGGFLVGFGARYAGGCTSGHAISGLSDLQIGSLVAVIGFFIGGLFMTHIIYPILLG
jgi:uncharacterized membrane protein YedE/YeeE